MREWVEEDLRVANTCASNEQTALTTRNIVMNCVKRSTGCCMTRHSNRKPEITGASRLQEAQIKRARDPTKPSCQWGLASSRKYGRERSS